MPRTITLRLPKLFYGWWIVAAASFASMVQGGIYTYGFSLFVLPVTLDFGWSRAEISGVFSFARLEGGLIGPLEGFLVDRYGPRRMILIGLPFMGLGYFLLSRVDSLLAFYLVFVLLVSVGSSLGLTAPANTAVANWFIRNRGRALGIVATGISVGGVLVPGTAWVIQQFGWRGAMVAMAVTIWTLCLPLAMVVRHRPETYGQLPDGGSKQRATSARFLGRPREERPEVHFTPREALRTPAFWLMSTAFATRSLVTSAIALHFMPFLVDMGLSQGEAALMFSLLALLSGGGRFFLGWLGDFIDKRWILISCFLSIAVGQLVLSQATELWQALLFIAIYAPAYGGPVAILGAIRGDYFGRRNFATIQGLMGPVMMLGTVAGPLFAGLIYDLTGGYRPAFAVFSVVILIGLALLLMLRQPKPATAPASQALPEPPS